MLKVTKSVGVMKEGILMEFHLLYLVQKCQHEKERKAPGKMKAKETKAEKMVNLLFLK